MLEVTAGLFGWSVAAGAAFSLCDKWDVLIMSPHSERSRDVFAAVIASVLAAPLTLTFVLVVGLLRPDLRRRARERRLDREMSRLNE